MLPSFSPVKDNFLSFLWPLFFEYSDLSGILITYNTDIWVILSVFLIFLILYHVCLLYSQLWEDVLYHN